MYIYMCLFVRFGGWHHFQELSLRYTQWTSAMFYFSSGLDTSQVYSRAAVSRLMRVLGEEGPINASLEWGSFKAMLLDGYAIAGLGSTAEGRVSS